MARVFILSSHPLFGQGVESLLCQQAGIEIVGQATDTDQAIARITALHPDTVIVDANGSANDSTPTILRILNLRTVGKVIGLNLENNTMNIYQGEQRVATQVDDLVDAIKTNSPHPVENAETKIIDRLSAEPAYRFVLYKILKFCETPRSVVEVENEIRSFPEMKTAILPPNTLLRWLEDAGGIERVGKEKDQLKTTAAGKQVIASQAPVMRLRELIAREPVYSDIYTLVLRFCATPKSRTEIETLLSSNPILESPKTYPTFFIQNLEAAGGLEWNGQWRTTEAGKGVAK